MSTWSPTPVELAIAQVGEISCLVAGLEDALAWTDLPMPASVHRDLDAIRDTIINLWRAADPGFHPRRDDVSQAPTVPPARADRRGGF